MSQTSLKNILLPTDFSELSKNAISAATEICKRHDAILHVLHVVENKVMIAPPDAIKAAIYLIPELEKAGAENLASFKKKLKKNIRSQFKPVLAMETLLMQSGIKRLNSIAN